MKGQESIPAPVICGDCDHLDPFD